MIENPGANEAKDSETPHLTPQLGRLAALHPGKTFSQPACEEKSEKWHRLSWVGVRGCVR